MTILTTRRLVVRELVEDDAQAMFAYKSEDSFRRELPDEALDSAKHALAEIQFFRGRYRERSLPLVYGIAPQGSEEIIGHIELAALKDGSGVEVGYAVAAGHRSKGFAKEIIQPFCDWAKVHLQVDKLYGLAKDANTPSWRTLEHGGFTLLQMEKRNFWGKEFLFRIYTY